MEATSVMEDTVPAGLSKIAAKGNPADLAEIYDLHAAAVYRLLLGILNSAADAQDALSEVFLAVSRQNSSKIRHLRAYLLTAARNQAIAILRRRRREIPTDPADLCFFDSAQLEPQQIFLAHRIEAALRELPSEQREVIVLKIYEGLTFAEIARITRTRPNTAASRYRYAADKLRRLLEEGND
jgi:RNA polymerase sigma-70 factor (ECF subfamily)